MNELPLFYRVKDGPLLDQFIAENFLHEAIRQGKTFAIAEGKFTGGAIINKITIPHSTYAFHIGTVVNNKKQKEILLSETYKEKGEAAKIVDQIGKDSPEIAIEMAKSIKKLRNDDIGIATTVERTGKGKDIGKLGNLMHVAFSSDSGTIVKSHFLTNEELENSTFLANRVLVDGYEYLTGKSDTSSNSNGIIKEISEPFEIPELEKLNWEISDILRFHKLTISSIESCTGGAVADFMTNNFTHYQDFFDSSWVVYDEQAKEVLGVPSSVMNFGMVYSEKNAEEMAKALRKKTKSHIVIATTGVMEAIDTRKYHDDYLPGTVFYAIMVGQELKTYSLKLDLQRRDLMKKEIIKAILNELSAQLKQNKKIEGLFQERIERSDYNYW